jgi:hypothetical protein
MRFGRLSIISRAVLILLGSAGGIALAVILAQFLGRPLDHQLSGYLKLGNAPMADEAWLDDKAHYDFLAFTFGAWSKPPMVGAKAGLIARNPGISLGTYFSMFTAAQWTKRAYESYPDSWGGRWWAGLSPYLARTNENDPVTGRPDTAAIFMNNYVWNVTLPAARAVAVDLLNQYVREEGLDWAMLDFCSVPLPNLKVDQGPQWEEMEYGDLDFDQNGIGHWDDFAEQQLLDQSWRDFIRELRAALPKSFLLIPNGKLAIEDPDFRTLVDGCYVEGFPMWHFGTPNANYTNALDPTYPNSLWNLCGKNVWHNDPGYVFLEDRFDRGQLGCVAALFDGAVEMKRMFDEVHQPATPPDLGLGAPKDRAEIEDGAITRAYEHGTVIVRPLSQIQISVAVKK